MIAVLGRGPENTMLAVGLAGIAGYARLIRSQVLQVRLSGYVEHAIALGEHPLYIVFRHIIPNTLRPLLIVATIGVGHAVLSASALSFLGLGVVPPTAEWARYWLTDVTSLILRRGSACCPPASSRCR